MQPQTAHSLIPTLIYSLAHSEPRTLWAEYPSSATTYTTGFSQITYAQLANAINGCAHFLTKALGRSNTGEAMAWLAPNDPRCTIALVAALKASFKLFLISERNSVAANHKLLDDVACSTMLTTSLAFAPVQATREGREIVVLELPSLEALVDQHNPVYPFERTLEASAREAALIVHTSGSTGFPKAVFITHEFLAKTLRNFEITAPDGYITQTSLIERKRCVYFLQLGHPAGITFSLLLPLSTRSYIIIPLTNIPPTGEALVEILTHITADWAALAPLTLETISKNPSLLSKLDSNLSTLIFSGGSLPKIFGDEITQRTGLKLLSFPRSKVTFLTVDLTHPTFALEGPVYEALRVTATHVFHNAWKVDFNLPLQSFEPQLEGVANLIRLCAHASRSPTIVFLSSVSAAMNFASTSASTTSPKDTAETTQASRAPITEKILPDLTAPAAAGYAESKHISERLLAHASDRLNLPSKVLRMGQIAGAARSPGKWNATDWVPALILGSMMLRAIPEKLNGLDANESVVDWVPVDVIADVIVEIGLYADPGLEGESERDVVSVFHPLNPHRTSWALLVPSIISTLESQSRCAEQGWRIKVVSPAEWISKLRSAARGPSSASDEGVNPALRLLDFFSERFGGLSPGPESLRWETGCAASSSKTLRDTEGIDGRMMSKWVGQWLESEKVVLV
ncbi:hypothetical protein BJX64DRAFT_284420 [Aspergillus heterothallicus]